MQQLIVLPQHLSLFLKCPRKALFSWSNPIPILSPQAQIISKTIKNCFLSHLRLGEIPNWRKVIATVDINVVKQFKDKPTIDKEFYDNSKMALSSLHSWYYKDYIRQPGMVNLPIIGDLGDKVKYYDKVDILAINKDKTYCLIEITENTSENLRYNTVDPMIPIRVSIINRISPSTVITRYIKIIIQPRSIKQFDIEINNSIINRYKKVIPNIFENIYNNMFYPSVSEQCFTCPFQAKCKL